MSVSGDSVTETTITSLISFTNYFIQVAAVNSADTGEYTDPVIVETIRSMLLGYMQMYVLIDYIIISLSLVKRLH